eukprot:gene11670-17994_t
MAALAVNCEAAWNLVWSDEFSGSAVDTTKWNFEVNCAGGGNGEKQCYTSSSDNAYVSDGVLTIKAMPATDADSPLPYTSARLTTKGKGDWVYGRFEARIQLPHGQGSWPAFWMLPSNNTFGRSIQSGEIDIVETVNLKVNGQSTIHGTMHYGGNWPMNAESSVKIQPPTNPADGYHVYAVEWEEGEIRWYYDGGLYATQRRSIATYDAAGAPTGLTQRGWYTMVNKYPVFGGAPFDKEFYMLLNVAVGGGWPESADATGIDADAFANGQFMHVDYVRVYECTPDSTGCATKPSNYDATIVEGKAPNVAGNSAGTSCSVCRGRIAFLVAGGSSKEAARAQVLGDHAECGACEATCLYRLVLGGQLLLVRLPGGMRGMRAELRVGLVRVLTDFPAKCGSCLNTCAAVWDTLTCTRGECSTCGSRIENLVRTGVSEAAAKRAVGIVDFPTECGPCAVTCSDVWDTLACSGSSCHTCGDRIDNLITVSGLSDAAARFKTGAVDYPAECGACALDSPAVTPSPTTVSCEAVWDTLACTGSACYSCGDRIEYLIDFEGMTEAAAKYKIGVTDHPAECGPCAFHVSTPSPPTCDDVWETLACTGSACYSCGDRIEYLIDYEGMTEAAAKYQIAVTDHPAECGPCAV